LEEIISRDTSVILITNSGADYNNIVTERFSRDTNSNIINVPKCSYYNELLGLIPLQLLAYYISVLREINPDKPKNLAKVVTVE
jgi:glucosamine--fructose-6-phosphate aminotransferase (isomerizing)